MSHVASIRDGQVALCCPSVLVPPLLVGGWLEGGMASPSGSVSFLPSHELRGGLGLPMNPTMYHVCRIQGDLLNG